MNEIQLIQKNSNKYIPVRENISESIVFTQTKISPTDMATSFRFY